MWQVVERMMNAVTFAEAGDYETANYFLSQNLRGRTVVQKAEAGQMSLAEKAGHYMRAITFAEEGAGEYAQEALQAVTPVVEPQKAKSILVLGNEDTFADYLVDYALDMAERFNFEIIALSALPISKKTRLLTGFADEIEERFKTNASIAGSRFQRRAEERGIRFHQEIRLVSEQKAIRQLHKESSNIEFVLTEPEANTTTEEAPECDGAVCVCSLVG